MAHATIVWAVEIREMRARDEEVPDAYRVALQAALVSSLCGIFFFFLSANLFLGFPCEADGP